MTSFWDRVRRRDESAPQTPHEDHLRYLQVVPGARTPDEHQARPIVDYQIVRPGEIPRRSGLAYDYLFGANGVFVGASSPLLGVVMPIAYCQIRGLPAIGTHFELAHGKVDGQLWDMLIDILDASHHSGCEQLVAIAYDPERGYHLVHPEQQARELAVEYTPGGDDWLLEIHSHRELAARPSSTDNHDEQRLRLYGVVGHMDRDVPQVNLRVGAYGYFLPVRWDQVFDGDPVAVDDVNVPRITDEESVINLLLEADAYADDLGGKSTPA